MTAACKKGMGLWRRFLARGMAAPLFWGGVAAVVLLRLLVAACQRPLLLPQSAPIDDALMIRAAQELVNGNWLGDYHGLAIAKNMGFSLWLALAHWCGLPVLVANALLWLGCAGFAAWALRPLFAGRLARLCLFAFLALQPVGTGQYAMRVYRDAVFPAFCLLVFAGALGLCLRAKGPGLRGAVGCALGCGAGLAGVWLLREDGAVVLVYAVCALALAVLFILGAKASRRRKAGGVLAAALPFAVLGGGILAFCAGNAAHYGVFMVNDLTSGAFPRAYGATVGVSRAASGHTPQVPVTRRALELMFEQVPALAGIEEHLTSGPAYNGYKNADGEIGGSFYYALKAAAYNAGKTPNGKAAQLFWARLADEIEQAVAEGRLPGGRAAATVVPAWDASLFLPTLAETGRGLLACLTFANCEPWPQESPDDPAQVEAMAEWLHTGVQSGYVENTARLYYSLPQRVALGAATALLWIYRVLIWVLLAAALLLWARFLGRQARAAARRRAFTAGLLRALAVLGLLLAFLLRLVVTAYMEQAAFGIGTYPMYLAGGIQALLLFCAAGAALPAAGADTDAGRDEAAAGPAPAAKAPAGPGRKKKRGGAPQ